MKEILLKCVVVSLSISLLIVIGVMIFDIVKTLISLKKTKKNKNDENASEREALLKSDEKMYSIINHARATLTEEEKSHIICHVIDSHLYGNNLFQKKILLLHLMILVIRII